MKASVLDGVDSQCHATAVLLPRKRASTLYTGGWLGTRASLDGNGKSRPPPGFDLRTIRPIARHYSHYTIVVHSS